MSVVKRSKINIYLDVLDLMYKEGAMFGKASPTRVAFRANLPYVRFQKIIKSLTEIGMVRPTDNGLLITERGLHCLNRLRQANTMLNESGLNL